MVSIYFVNQLLADKNISLSCYREYVSIVEKGLSSLAMYLQRKGKRLLREMHVLYHMGQWP